MHALLLAEGPPPLSSTRRCSEASTRDLLGAPTGGRGGGFDEDLDEDFASRADLGGDYPMMAMMPAPPLAPSPGAPPPPAYFYGLQPPPPPPPPMYPVSFNPAGMEQHVRLLILTFGTRVAFPPLLPLSESRRFPLSSFYMCA